MKVPRLFLSLIIAMFLFNHASADPLAVGATAPNVTALTDEGTQLSLGEVYKKGCSLRDSYEVLLKKGVTVVGVSTDTVEAQKKFREENHLPFTLLADHDQAVIKAFGVPVKEVPVVGAFASRQAYLIDRNGKIVWCDYKASTKEQADDVLKALAALDH